jgi:hypothetical protein
MRRFEMDNYYYSLKEEHIQTYKEKGYLLVEGFLNKAEVQLLQQWSQEVYDLPRTPEVPWMPYEVR